jgi:hypothetical protein
MKTPKYVEHENVIYRGEEDGSIFLLTEMLVGGKWVPAWEGWKARAFGMPMSEAEARAFHGDGWPKEEAQAAGESGRST